jgi:GTPase-associated system helical domain
MPVRKEFADWYRAASISPPQELLEQRWNGVEEAATSLTAPALTTLLRLFSIRQQPGYRTPEFIDAAFRKHDTTFPTSGNLEELRVLSGAVLRHVTDSALKPAVAAALGLVSSSYGRSSSLPTLDHVTSAERFLAKRAASVREVKSAPQVDATALPRERFDHLMPPGVFAQNKTPEAREPLFSTLSELADSIDQSLNDLSAAMWHIIQAQREELNLLWWLQAKFSRDLEKPFGECTVREACLVFPTEVAKLTAFIPGPAAALGLLISSLDCAREQTSAITVLDAVKSSPRQWRNILVSEQKAAGVEELCPVLLAISKSLETEGEDDWLPVYRRYCDVRIDETTQPIDVAYQLYRELLFSRAISELKR